MKVTLINFYIPYFFVDRIKTFPYLLIGKKLFLA